MMNSKQYRASIGGPSLGTHKELAVVDGNLVTIEVANTMDDIGYDDWIEMRENGVVG